MVKKVLLIAMVALMGLLGTRAQAQKIIDTWSFNTGVDTTLWYDIDGVDSTILAGPMSSGRSGQVPIGFPFTLGPATHSVFSVNVNGTVHFGPSLISTYQYFNQPLSNNYNNNGNCPKVEPFGWRGRFYDDSYTRYALLGDSGSRVLVIETRMSGSYWTYGSYCTFQVQLFETGGLRMVFGESDDDAATGAAQMQNGIATDNDADKDVIFIDYGTHEAVRWDWSSYYSRNNSTWPEKGRWYMVQPDSNYCPYPSNVSVQSDNPTSLTLSTSGNQTDMRLQVPVVGVDTIWPMGQSTFVVTTPFNPETQYQGTLQSVCDSGKMSYRTRSFNIYTDCGDVIYLPWTADFSQFWECWDWSQNTGDNKRWTRTSSGIGLSTAMRSGTTTTQSYDEWLLVPVFDLPDTNGLTLRWNYEAQVLEGVAPTVDVRVALCAADGTVDSADWTTVLTLNSVSTSTTQCYINLDAWRGQRVRVAFVRTGTGGKYAAVDNFRLYLQHQPIMELSAPAVAHVGDTTVFTATRLTGVDSNVVWTWHSALLDSTWVMNGFNGVNGQSVLNIVYPALGFDTVTVVLATAYGADTMTAAVDVVDCSPVTVFPWSEDFVHSIDCWPTDGWQKYSNSHGISAKDETGTTRSYYDLAYCNTVGKYMITPPIVLPATGMENMALWVECDPTLEVRLSPTGSTDPADFTDTLIIVPDNGSNQTMLWYTADLEPYAGQTVRAALFKTSGNTAYVNTVKVDYDTLPRLRELTAPAKSATDSTIVYTATLRRGSTDGLTYTWHSSLMDSTVTLPSLSYSSTWLLQYNRGGVDTIKVIAANDYGADTLVKTVRVKDCYPATLPWKEDFQDGDICWYKNAICKWYDAIPANYSAYEHLRYLYLNVKTDTSGSWIMSKQIQLPADSNLHPRLFWKVASSNSSYQHLYSVMVSTDEDRTDYSEYYEVYIDSSTHVNFSNYDQLSVDLTQYAGQNIYVAFVNAEWHMAPSNIGLYIDDVEIRATAIPRITLVADGSDYYYGDSATFTATLIEGTTDGLTYTWHSTLLDSTWSLSNSTTWSLNYGLTNGYDTVTVIASNAYGSDTAMVVVNSVVITQPYISDFTAEEMSFFMEEDRAEMGDTVVYVITRNRCITTGLTYSLHSTLLDTTVTVATTADTCRFTLAYPEEGYDTITALIYNAYDVSDTATLWLTVSDCPAVSVPFFEDFDHLGEAYEYIPCWPGYYWLQPNGDSNLAARFAGVGSHYSLISPAIDLPADSLGLQLSWYTEFSSNVTSNVPIRILVSPTGSAHIADFTDVIFDRSTPNHSYDSLSLDAYRGQRIRIAFTMSGYYNIFDNIRIDYDRSAPRLTVSGPTTAATLEDNVYTANVTAGSPHGLTYSWRSSMVDQGLAHYRIQDSEFIINYFTGGTDTIRCIVANDYGADTQTVVVPVSGCGYVQLPYFEDFNAMAVGGKPDCWSVVWHKEPSCAPKVVAPGSFYFSPDNSRLLFLTAAANSTYYDTAAIVLLPAFDFPVASLKMSLWYAYEDTTIGTLSAGYMDNGRFVPVTELPVVGHSGRYDTISFASAPATATRLALCWKQMTNSTWYSASIDNVEVTTAALPHDVIYLTVNDSTATEISLDGPAAVYALDTNRYSAVVTAGPDSGLTYTWHSSMAARGLAQFSTLHSSLFTINYTSTGIDTVWLTVSNGMDTGVAYRVVTITAPLEVAITGSTRAIVGEGQNYRAAVTVGSHYGVSYSWHSTLLNSTWIDTTGVIDSIVLVYPFGGTDTLSVTATSPFTSYTASMVVTVTNCNISVFPAFEGFENDNCWITVNTVAGQGWTRRSAYRRSGNWSMEAVYPTHGNPTDDWLISPAIDLPANGTVTMTYYRFFQESEPFDRNYEPKVQMRVSTTGRNDTTLFTDTVPITYIGLIGNFWKAYSVSLADYQGQTVYLAFRNRETVHPGGYSSMEWHLAIDDLAFTVDQVPVISLNTDEVYYTCDTAVATVDINRYDSLQYDIRWHSRMVDRGLAQFEVRGSEFRIDYLVGGRDTISVAVSNAYGTDSVWRAVDVHYCEVVNDFPHVFRPVTDDAEWGCWKRWNLSPDRYGGWGRGYDYYNHGYGSYLCIMSKATYNSSYNPDEWLVSPLIALPSNAESITLHWHGFCEESTFNLEISTTGRDSAAQFTTTLYSQTNGSLYTPQMQEHWSYYNVDISSYRGQTVSLAFHNVGPVDYPYGYVALDTMWIECTLDTTPVPPDTVWHTVTVLCDSTMGTVSGAGTYEEGTTVTLTATPHEGYRFVIWSDSVTAATRTVKVDTDTTLTAYFAPDTTFVLPDTVWRTVSVTTDAPGACEAYGSGRYPDSSTVEIGYTMMDTATVGGHWQFLGWSDGVSGNPRDILVTSDTAIMALFEWIEDSVGIGNLIDNQYVSVYPNPAFGDVTVKVGQLSILTVLDLQGRTVIPPTPVNSTFIIQHSLLLTGTYFVRIVTEGGVTIKKLIMQ